MRALIYTRISNDRAGAGLGVERQRKDCENLADALGWTVVETFADNDISAYSGKRRPGYEALLDALRGGRATAVLAWHTDRLHRSPAELEEFIAICERHAVTVRTVQAGPLDLATPAGQMTARIMGAVARHEIDHARRRMVNAHRQAAENGRAHGRLVFGYAAERDSDGKITRRVPHPDEAPLVREAVERVLAGESLYAVRNDWTARGIRTRAGRPWSPQSFREMLQRPTYAALRVHNGETTPGTWEPIITPDQHYRLVSLLTSATRTAHRGTAPRYLLSGIARCGVCGEPLWRLKGKTTGIGVYQCTARRCISRKIEPVDRLVAEAVVRWAEQRSSPDDLDDPETAAAQREARELRAKLNRMIELVDEDQLTPESLAKYEQRVLPRIRRLESRATVRPHPAVLELLGSNARANWAAMDLADRRSVIRSLVRVEIMPTTPGARFDPAHVRVTWL